MALFPCLQGGGGSAITAATLSVSSPVSIDAGHLAVVSVFQNSQLGTPTASVTISGTEDVDYEVIFSNDTPDFYDGQINTQAGRARVIRAINNITITTAHSGGTNYTGGASIVYDLS